MPSIGKVVKQIIENNNEDENLGGLRCLDYSKEIMEE